MDRNDVNSRAKARQQGTMCVNTPAITQARQFAAASHDSKTATHILKLDVIVINVAVRRKNPGVRYKVGMSPSAGYPLPRTLWCRRKHRYVRRAIRRLSSSLHTVLGNSIVANTSGRTMTSGGSHNSSIASPT